MKLNAQCLSEVVWATITAKLAAVAAATVSMDIFTHLMWKWCMCLAFFSNKYDIISIHLTVPVVVVVVV